MPTGTYEEMADYLAEGYWNDRNASPHHWDHTLIRVNIDGLQSSDQILAQQAFTLWADYTPLVFNYTSSSADITFQDTDPGAATTHGITNGVYTSAKVNISTTWGGGVGADFYSYRFETFIHEIGHALGLGHQGNYNSTLDYPNDLVFDNDSRQTSVMSYVNPSVNTTIIGDDAYVLTPQIVDILAIRDLYGSGSLLRTHDTTYGVGNNTGRLSYGEFSDFNSPLVTIYDDGGNDTLNYSGPSWNQTINVNAGTFSSVYGLDNNVLIAPGSEIENAIGGSGRDIIYGSSAANELTGNGGKDDIFGEGGDDEISGGSGDDNLFGRDGNDTIRGGDDDDNITGGNGTSSTPDRDFIYGEGGNDRLVGGAGVDYIDGGPGEDTAAYTDHGPGAGQNPFAVKVDLQVGTSYQGAEGSGSWIAYDTLVSIENVEGSAYGDEIIGDDGANRLQGGGGDDELTGNGGNDTLLGDTGDDTLIGSKGRDMLLGGGDDDMFVFTSKKDSKKGGQRDKILDFNRRDDTIDLSEIDAKKGGGNQKFKWIGKKDFHDKKGELRYEDKGKKVIVQGDIKGNGKADFEIFVNVGKVTDDDFVL